MKTSQRLTSSSVVRRAALWGVALAVVLACPATTTAQVPSASDAASNEPVATTTAVVAAGVAPTVPAAGSQIGTQGVAAVQDTVNRPLPSVYDRIWRFSELYKDDSNRVVQRVQFTGRFQHDFASVGADQGDVEEWNVRRLRVGPRVALFRRLTVHTELELNPQERDPFYVRFTDAYVQWTVSSSLATTIGKQSVPFTLDGATSSKDLLTIDRSNLANNMWFPQEYMPGVSVSGRKAPWVYRAGIYTAGAANREFGEFSGGLFTLGTLGYDFSASLGVKEALLSGHYVYQHPDQDNTFTRRLDHVASVNFRLETDRWGVRTDLSAASGYLDQRGMWGLTAMPFMNLTSQLQLVGRYTVLDSGLNGLQLGTYENRIVRGRGDRYHEGYVGANYYLYGHRLKLQTGVQMANMRDIASDGGQYSGVSWTSGLRVGW